jgi:hypothetical protein
MEGVRSSLLPTFPPRLGVQGGRLYSLGSKTRAISSRNGGFTRRRRVPETAHTPCGPQSTPPISAQIIPSLSKARRILPAAVLLAVSKSAPEAIARSGSSPNTRQTCAARVGTGTAEGSNQSFRPLAWASSQRAVTKPPSVGSRIAVTLPAASAIWASRKMLIPGSCRKNRACLSSFALRTPANRSGNSRAKLLSLQ